MSEQTPDQPASADRGAFAAAERLTTLGHMSVAIAHELNQPLSAVANYLRGSLRLLDQDQPDLDRVRDALRQAADQTLRAGHIIRRLRSYVSSGEAEPAVASLPPLVEGAVEFAMMAIKEQAVRLSFQFDDDLPLALVDATPVQQVIVNLVRNAAEAMAGAPRRELCVGARLTGAEMVEVFVADTGPGLAPEVRDRLFSPFNSTKSSGMGVGLAICRSIVEAHGGRIWAEPNGDGGETFRFTLPAVGPSELAHAP